MTSQDTDNSKSSLQDTDNSKSSLYVLACSTVSLAAVGTLISLAALRIVTASTYASGFVA